MADSFVKPGDVVTVVCPLGGVSAGAGVLIGTLFGVATHDAAAGAALELAVTGQWTLAKEQPLVLTQGARVFWVPGAGNFNDTAAGQVCIGVTAEADAAGTATTLDVILRASTAAGL